MRPASLKARFILPKSPCRSPMAMSLGTAGKCVCSLGTCAHAWLSAFCKAWIQSCLCKARLSFEGCALATSRHQLCQTAPAVSEPASTNLVVRWPCGVADTCVGHVLEVVQEAVPHLCGHAELQEADTSTFFTHMLIGQQDRLERHSTMCNSVLYNAGSASCVVLTSGKDVEQNDCAEAGLVNKPSSEDSIAVYVISDDVTSACC